MAITEAAAAKKPAKALPFVEGLFNYLAPMTERPFTYTYDPPPGKPRSNIVVEPHRMPVYDMRPIAGRVSLDGEGFALVTHKTAARDFDDESVLREVYYPEAQEVIAAATGAKRVIVFDHTVRRRRDNIQDRQWGMPRQPATRVHNDYTLRSAPQRVRDLMGDEAGALLKRRYAFINLWRPIVEPVLDTPLACCEAKSASLDDFVASDLIYRDRDGEIYQVRHNPRHRWYYVPAMRCDEAVLIKCFDSDPSVARFVAHSAFEDPTTPKDAPPRESIELRTIAFYD